MQSSCNGTGRSDGVKKLLNHGCSTQAAGGRASDAAGLRTITPDIIE